MCPCTHADNYFEDIGRGITLPKKRVIESRDSLNGSEKKERACQSERYVI